jgi:hypothetical protein
MTPVQHALSCLLGVRKEADHQWMAHCPVHAEHALRVTETDTRRVQLSCSGGCDETLILTYLGLAETDLDRCVSKECPFCGSERTAEYAVRETCRICDADNAERVWVPLPKPRIHPALQVSDLSRFQARGARDNTLLPRRTEYEHAKTRVNAILIPITDLEALKAAGLLYPATVDAWRWAYRRRKERGLSEAFVKFGSRILVDVTRFANLTRTAGPRGL